MNINHKDRQTDRHIWILIWRLLFCSRPRKRGQQLPPETSVATIRYGLIQEENDVHKFNFYNIQCVQPAKNKRQRTSR
jgi:hypothetical protein